MLPCKNPAQDGGHADGLSSDTQDGSLHGEDATASASPALLTAVSAGQQHDVTRHSAEDELPEPSIRGKGSGYSGYIGGAPLAAAADKNAEQFFLNRSAPPAFSHSLARGTSLCRRHILAPSARPCAAITSLCRRSALR